MEKRTPRNVAIARGGFTRQTRANSRPDVSSALGIIKRRIVIKNTKTLAVVYIVTGHIPKISETAPSSRKLPTKIKT